MQDVLTLFLTLALGAVVVSFLTLAPFTRDACAALGTSVLQARVCMEQRTNRLVKVSQNCAGRGSKINCSGRRSVR